MARIAAGQHGVISVKQLLEAGISRERIARWVRTGRLHREFRGVYRLGHKAPNTNAHYLAAVLACGPGTFLSGLAAAHVYGLIKAPPPAPEVTSLAAKKHPGITTRRVRNLHPKDTRTYNAIPITTVPRTLVDLAATLSLDALAVACHKAEVKHHVRAAAVAAVVRRRGRSPGTPKLRAIFLGDHHLTLSRMEKDFLALLKANRLPLPQTNRRKGAHFVDCRWPGHHLTVELDSYRFHHSRHAWEQDRQRERAARTRGDEFRRYTYRDVCEDSTPILADLQALLTSPGR